MNPPVSPSTGHWLARPSTLGLGGSAHCLAMCSGIAAAAAPRGPGLATRLRGSLTLNAGRLATYVVLGVAVGAAVRVTRDFDRPAGVWWPARIVVAALSSWRSPCGCWRAGTCWAWRRGAGQGVWRRIRPLTRRAADLPVPLRTVAIGAIWGLLPCGLVYSALALAAASGTPLGGALVMGVFGLTTLPAMEAMALGGSTLIGWLKRRATQRLAGAVLMAAALATAARPCSRAVVGPVPGVAGTRLHGPIPGTVRLRGLPAGCAHGNIIGLGHAGCGSAMTRDDGLAGSPGLARGLGESPRRRVRRCHRTGARRARGPLRTTERCGRARVKH